MIQIENHIISIFLYTNTLVQKILNSSCRTKIPLISSHYFVLNEKGLPIIHLYINIQYLVI